ncbi:hypothetical protein OAK01_04600 [Candidatus Nitrosopelagicus sp.]|nr:hypothetical protein [Candidatus Nitrosopelagicus sp.]
MFPKTVFAIVAFSVFSLVPAAFADTISVDIGDSTYNIEYTATDLTISSVTADMDFISLIFEVDVLLNEGQLEFNFDRDFFDAKLGSEDDDFFVIVDGDELSFEETKDDSHRSISFLVDPGTEEIEIIGSDLAGASYILEQEAEVKAEQEAIKQEEEEKEAEIISILEEQCGEGTILEDGVCILENPIIESPPIDSTPLLLGIFGAMGIGLAVVLILWGIGKRSNKVIPPERN